MGKRGGGKVIMKKSAADKDVYRVFNEMLSDDHANIDVAWPKYTQILEYIDEFVKIFVLLKKSNIMTNPDLVYGGHIEEIDAFLHHCVRPLPEFKEAAFIEPFSKSLLPLNSLNEGLSAEFIDKYNRLKTLNVVNAMQVICDKLSHYQSDIEDVTNLDPSFIIDMPGVEFQPFPFTTMDYKDMFLDEEIDDQAKKYLMLILHKVYSITYSVYKLVTSPDVDIDEFVDIVLGNLDRLKKNATELSRCGKAFNKIRKSAEMLKANFETYFRDVQETNDPTMLMQNFILDVAQTSDADRETMRQFKQIINYYRKKSAQKGGNPQTDMLLAKVDAHFKQYDEEIKKEYGEDAVSDKEEIELTSYQKDQIRKIDNNENDELTAAIENDGDIDAIKEKYQKLRDNITNV